MRIIIAEDDVVSRRFLEATLSRAGHNVLGTGDGRAAWRALVEEPGPAVAILDWMMPGMSGLDVCRRARQEPHTALAYLILLTARGSRHDVVEGLGAGADDYITKPFDRDELLARVRVGVRVAELQMSLAERVKQLEEAAANIHRLQGLLPICAYCKKVRNDQNYWQQVEAYLGDHSDLVFSHGICPDCFEKFIRPELARISADKPKKP